MRTLLMNLLVRYPAIAWLMGAIGLVPIFIGMGQLRDFHRLQQAGVKTQGALVSIVGEPGKAADIEYTFDAAGRHYTGKTEVGAEDRASLHIGDKIDVIYQAGNPAQNLTAVSWPSTAYILNMVGAMLVFMPVAITIKRRHDRRQQMAR
jgi:hypothetical protein